MRGERVLRGGAATALLCGTTPVWAAAQAEADGSLSGWAILLLAVGALVILFQAVPAVVMLTAMVKELFGRETREARATRESP